MVKLSPTPELDFLTISNNRDCEKSYVNGCDLRVDYTCTVESAQFVSLGTEFNSTDSEKYEISG